MDQFDLCSKCGNSHEGACSTQAIYFYYHPQPTLNPHEVYIIGDWSKWQRKQQMTRGQLQNGDTYFYILLALSQGKHQYKFLVDSLWLHDTSSPTVINSLGNYNNIVDILPKKTYIEKHCGSNVKITSNLVVEPLMIIGSWDEWTEELTMTKCYNLLRNCYQNVIHLDLQPNKTYQFKFKHQKQYFVDQKYPTTTNNYGTLNNYIIVYQKRISVETPSRVKKISNMEISNSKCVPKGRVFKWHRVASITELPYERVEGHNMCSVGEYLYVFGGKSRNQFYNSMLKINSKLDKVCFQEIVPDGRAFHCMKTYGNKILIYGGHNNVVLQDYHSFNVSDSEWQGTHNLAKNHTYKLQKQSCVLYEDLLVFFGGYYCQEEAQYESLCYQLQVLDLQKMQWIDNIKIQGDHPKGRYGHTASIIQSSMYIFGGIYDPIKILNLNDLWKLNLQNVKLLKWQQIQPRGTPPSPRHGHTMNSLSSLLIVFGGQDDQNRFLNDLYVYHTLQNEWITPLMTGTIPKARYNHASTNFLNDQIIVFGGKTADNAKNRGFYILQAADLAKSTSFFNEREESQQDD